MAKLANIARMSTATVGTGTITLGSATSGFLSFAGAGITNGQTVTYGIEDGANREIGRGTYTTSGTTLTRTVLKSTNSDNPISLSGTAEVFITPAAEDIANLGEANVFTAVNQFTTVELGHPTDTTISRVSAGVVAIEGVNVLTTNTGIGTGKHTMWLPAGSFVAKSSNGAGASTYDSGSNDLTLKTWDFDTATQEYIHSIPIGMPKSWNEGTVTAIVYWTNTAGLTTETVRWSVAGVAISDDDTLNATFGTAQVVDDTWLAQNDLHITSETSAITIGGTPAESDLVIFEVSRVVASDNMTGDAKFIGMKIIYTINVSTDA